MRFIIALLIVLASSVAHAQPGETQSLPAGDDDKNPAIAGLLSTGIPFLGLIATAKFAQTGDGPYGVAAAGALILGPSTGRWYAGEIGGGTLALRTLGGLSMVAGIAGINADWDCDDAFDANCSSEREHARSAHDRGKVLLIGGAGLWIGTTIADIVLARRAIHRHNREHAVTVTPGLVGTTGKSTPGMFVSLRF